MKKKEFAEQCLSGSLAEVRAGADRLKENAGADAVHDLRVAMRRARVLLRAYESLLDRPTRRVEASFQRLGHLLGEARDCHTAATLLADRQALADSPAGLRTLVMMLRRREARKIAEARGRIPSVVAAQRALTRSLGSGKSNGTCPKAYARWLQKRLRKRNRRLKAAIDSVTGDRSPGLHRARIDLKKMRYLAGTLTGHRKRTKRLLTVCRKAQNTLGELHDLAWAASRIPPRRRNLAGVRRALEAENRIRFRRYEKDFRRLAETLEKRIAAL